MGTTAEFNEGIVSAVKLNELFVFDPAVLQELAARKRVSYAEAKPFPHIVIDDLIREDVLAEVVAEFPQPKQIEWIEYDAPTEKKLASKDEAEMGYVTRFLLYQFNSAVFLNFLETLTGIEGLIPDPYFWGGGLHQTQPGGFLKIHADFNWHDKLRLDRRINVLLYLNKDWKEEYGGHLELWNKEMTECGLSVLPVFNRCLIFNTTDSSYHGNANPLTCPIGHTRKSLALYYYSNGRPDEEVSDSHTTLFQHRPGEEIPLKSSARAIIKQFIPPILIDVGRSLMRRHR